MDVATCDPNIPETNEKNNRNCTQGIGLLSNYHNYTDITDITDIDTNTSNEYENEYNYNNYESHRKDDNADNFENNYESYNKNKGYEDSFSDSFSDAQYESNGSISNGIFSDAQYESIDKRSFKVEIMNEMLYDGSDITTGESILHLFNLYIQHKLTKASLQSILQLLQQILSKHNNMPKAIHDLFQLVIRCRPQCTVIKHYYCKKCLFYNGSYDVTENCASCSPTQGMSIFYELDIIDQIKSLFEHRNLAEKLRPFKHRNDNIISDITNGSEYIRVNSHKDRQAYDLTLILNTDGLSLVKSSKSHCWPLIAVIAELPEYLRNSFMFTIGLWYDSKHKPDMNTFLQPFCEKLNKYFRNGIQWINPKTNKVCISKITAPLIIADAPVRAQLQNILNFNGIYGCNICEIKTKTCMTTKRKKNIRVYAFQEEVMKLRTGEEMEK